MKIEIQRLLLNMRAMGVLVLLMSLVTVMPNAVQAQNAEENTRSAVHAMTFTQLQDKFYKTEIKEKISVDVHEMTVEQALRVIARETGLRLSYRGDIMVDKMISIQKETTTVSDVLANVLDNTGLDYKISQDGYLLITEREDLIDEMFQETVTGTVVDAETGEALPGVNILIQGTTTGTSTNADGSFELTVPNLNETLVVTYIGYEQQQVLLDGRNELVIELNQLVVSGGELVVVGYGTQTRETLTGSVSRVDGTDLAAVPNTNVSNALAGRLPGLIAVNESGEPGRDGSRLLVRGIGTLGNNSPLIVIDGVPNREGGLNRLNPNDIESIDVLKDASAAIYGSQAANGVILVTTKRGTVGPPEFRVSVEQGLQQPTRTPKLADAPTYMQMVNEIEIAQGRTAVFSQDDIECSAEQADPWRCFDTDWFNVALNDWANQTKANLSVSGGNERTQYFISGRALTQDGIFKNSATQFNQVDLRVNLDNDITDHFKIGLDIAGRLEDRNFPTIATNQQFRMLMRGKPNEPAIWPNGLPAPDIENGVNPVVSSTPATGSDETASWFFQSNLKFDLEIPRVEGLSFRGTASFDKVFNDNKLWQTPFTLYDFTGEFDEEGEPIMNSRQVAFSEPQLSQQIDQSEDILLHLSSNFRQDLENHSFQILAGGEFQKSRSSYISAFRRFFPTTAIDQIFAGGEAEKDNDGSAFESKRLTAFSRVNYNYQSKYLLEILGRVDGSFIFPRGNRFGFFPAISAGWRVSQEDWFQDITGEFFDEFKLRGSWGKSGNDRIEAFQFLQTFEFTRGFIFNESDIQGGITPSQLPNPNITWEVATQLDIGLEANLMDSRLFVEFDYFNNNRDDILAFRNASIPSTAGFTLPRENIGKVSSWGFDGSASYLQNITSDFNIGVKMNLAYATNRIDFFDEPPGAPSYQLNTGSAIGTQLYFVSTGVFQDEQEIENTASYPGARPGDLIFEDVNGDGVIDSDDMVRINKTQTPKWTGGLAINGNFKQFDFNIFFQGAAGAHLYTFTQSGNFGNYFAEFANNRWTADNPSLTTPRPFNRVDEFWAANQNTFFLRSTDYVRLKNLEIGYTLPVTISDRLGIRNLRVYVSGFNLLTFFDDLSDLGLDPEAQSGAGFGYPQQRIINSGISLTF